MKKIMLVGAGGVSLALGIVGIFLPLLPTTPFLLLAAYCFLKSSARLHRWITNHRLFGAYLANYLRYRAVSLRAKIFSLSLLWSTIVFSVIFFIRAAWLGAALFVVAAVVTVHLLRLRTLTRAMLEGRKEIKGACPRAPRGREGKIPARAANRGRKAVNQSWPCSASFSGKR